MYHRILIPVAYEPGFDLGRELAVAQTLLAPGGRVTLLHAVEPAPFYALDYMPQGWEGELAAAITADLQAQAATLPGSVVSVVEDDPVRAILDHAGANGTDCIVLASHRSDPGLFGSVAAKVAQRAPCAVHLIR